MSGRHLLLVIGLVSSGLFGSNLLQAYEESIWILPGPREERNALWLHLEGLDLALDGDDTAWVVGPPELGARLASAGLAPRPLALLPPRRASRSRRDPAQRAADWLPADGYPDPTEVAQILQAFAQGWPGIAHVETLGTSHQGRPLLGLLISDDGRHDPDEPGVLILAQQSSTHARS